MIETYSLAPTNVGERAGVRGRCNQLSLNADWRGEKSDALHYHYADIDRCLRAFVCFAGNSAKISFPLAMDMGLGRRRHTGGRLYTSFGR